MYYRESGNADEKTIVFLHGGGISGWMWDRQTAHFTCYHCIVPDLPEHGRSMMESPLSIEDCAKKIASLIRERAKGGKAHLIGHSLGAKIIVEILARSPEVIDRAVIVSALFRPIPMMRTLCNGPSYRLAVWMLKSKKVLAYTARQFGFTDPEDADRLTDDFSGLTVDSLDHIYGELFTHLRLPDISRADAPSLVIAGEKEPIAMRESVRDIAGVLPAGKGILFKDAGHDIPWRADEAFNRTVREWIENREMTSDRVRPV